jgi:hypothetical protein
METLKAVGAFCFGLAILAGIGCLAIALFAGIARVSLEVFFYLGWIWQTTLLVASFVFLPLALFRATRMAAASGLYVASFVFGACTWIFGLIVTWNYWGLIIAFIGIAFFGVGVVPLAIVASAFHSDWAGVLAAIFGLALTFGSRTLALWLGNKVDQYNLERRMKIIDA